MTNDLLLLAMFIYSCFFLGRNVLRLLCRDGVSFDRLEGWSLSFGLGAGSLTLFLLFLSFIGVSFSIFWVLLFILFISLLTIRIFPIKALTHPLGFLITRVRSFISNKFDMVCFLAVVFLLFNFLMITFRTMIIERDVWDSWAFWAFKSKVFLYHQTVPFEMFESLKKVWGNWDYPLHLPLLETAVSLWIGRWDEFLYRIIFPLYYISLCFMLFSFLRREKGSNTAFLGACMLVSLPRLQSSTIGTIAETVMLFYWLSSFLVLLRWKRNFLQGEVAVGLLRLSAVLAGLSIWVKSEASILVLCNLLVLFFDLGKMSLKQRFFIVAGYSSLIVLISFPWQIVQAILGLSNNIFNANYLQSFQLQHFIARVLDIPRVLLSFLLNFHGWNILWFSFVGTFLYKIFFYRGRLAPEILRSMLILIAVYLFGYVSFPWEGRVFLSDTMQRLMLAPAVLAVLYISLVLGGRADNEKI